MRSTKKLDEENKKDEMIRAKMEEESLVQSSSPKRTNRKWGRSTKVGLCSEIGDNLWMKPHKSKQRTFASKDKVTKVISNKQYNKKSRGRNIII